MFDVPSYIRRKMKEKKERKQLEELGGVGLESSSTHKEKKSYFRRHKFQTAILIFLGIVVVPTYIGYKTATEKQELARQQELSRVQKLKSEPHSSLKYYLEEGTDEASLESAARLVAHVMETGCSKGYNALRDNFDAESMEYLQDYLLARNCKNYSSPPVVNVEITEYYGDYIVRLGSSRDRYELRITHDNWRPTSFKIKPYVANNKVKEEGTKETK